MVAIGILRQGLTYDAVIIKNVIKKYGDCRTLPTLIFNEYLNETGGNANLVSAISMTLIRMNI